MERGPYRLFNRFYLATKNTKKHKGEYASMEETLDDVITGKSEEPPRLIVYGTEGIGKSTFGASAPNPIFVQTEDGLGQIGCARMKLATSLEDVVAQLKRIRDVNHSYQTLVIDSLDWLEQLIFEVVCREYGCKNIERVDGGFGHGYQHARDKWKKEIVPLLNEIRNKRNMAIILLSHSREEKFDDPEYPAYDRHAPRLNKLACGYLCDWADAVMFATTRKRRDSDSGKIVPVGADGGERILRCIGSATCIAKNRYGLPLEIPFTWTGFIEAVKAAGKN